MHGTGGISDQRGGMYACMYARTHAHESRRHEPSEEKR